MREGMCAAAIRLLETTGADGVTTRAVAAESGSSLAAVHELFGGKSGLVRAMFSDGFARLASTLEDLDDDDGLQQVADTIRSFSREHPHVYDVMFSRPFAEFRPDAADATRAEVIYEAVVGRIATALGPGRARGSAKDAAVGFIALVRGLVDLERAGTLGSSGATIERRWSGSIDAFVNGWIAAAR